MRVLVWSYHLDETSARAAGAELVDKAQLLARSDAVTLHVRMGPRYEKLIGPAELALMKPGSILVNTSRGRLVDLDALSAALQAGHMRGAALDVFDEEPLPPGHPILSAPRTVLTPHIGYVTEATYERFFADAVDDILAYLAGRPVRVITEAVP
jgi:phosphoglycerate dehydrogenase-like enzyme